MPRFIFTVIIGTILAWAGVIFLGTEIAPNTTVNILLFSVTLFLSLGMTFAVGVFLVMSRYASVFLNRHILFRKSLKRGFFISFWLVGTLLLRVFNLFTPIVYILFLVLCLLIFQSFRSSRV